MLVPRHTALVGIGALGIAPAEAQPPIHGFNGTMATEATIRSEHKAANKIVVATEDGVEVASMRARDQLSINRRRQLHERCDAPRPRGVWCRVPVTRPADCHRDRVNGLVHRSFGHAASIGFFESAVICSTAQW